MSLSWRDRVRLSLAPEGWSARRLTGLWPHRAAAPARGRCASGPAEAPWRPALAAAAAALAAAPWSNAALEVILADALVRYRILPWQAGLAGEDEEAAYARLNFREVYGAAADAWEIRCAAAPPGEPRLACAIDAALLAELGTLAGGRAPASVRPAFVASFERLRARLGGPLAGLALAADHHITLGVLAEGRWLTLAARHVDGPPEEALARLVLREALRGGWPASGGAGLVVGAAAPPATPGGWHWQAAPQGEAA